MMSSKEKEIAEQWDQGKALSHKSIYDDYTRIGKIRYEFEKQKIYSRINILMPVGFIDLPLSAAKLRYPSEDRPKVIKSSLDSLINFAFCYWADPVKPEDLPKVSRIFAAAIRRLFPAHEFKESGARYLDRKMTDLLCWYEYLSPDFKGKIYNMHGFLAVEGKLMQIVFNCPEDRYQDWKPVVLEVFETVYSDLDHQFRS